jgi:hypothetical protein
LQTSDFFLPQLEKELRRRHDFDIRNASVREALVAVERTIGVPMKVDYRALAENARAEDDDLRAMRITIVGNGLQGRTALTMLREQGILCTETPGGLAVDYGSSEKIAGSPYTWRYYPTGDLARGMTGNRASVRPSDRNLILAYVVQVFGDNTIACHNEADELHLFDSFGFTGHLYYGPRYEHRHLGQLYAGMREALRRRPEILRLAGLAAGK